MPFSCSLLLPWTCRAYELIAEHLVSLDSHRGLSGLPWNHRDRLKPKEGVVSSASGHLRELGSSVPEDLQGGNGQPCHPFLILSALWGNKSGKISSPSRILGPTSCPLGTIGIS